MTQTVTGVPENMTETPDLREVSRCNNCGFPINERGPVFSCVTCLDGQTPGLRDFLCEKCRERHRRGHGLN